MPHPIGPYIQLIYVFRPEHVGKTDPDAGSLHVLETPIADVRTIEDAAQDINERWKAYEFLRALRIDPENLTVTDVTREVERAFNNLMEGAAA